MRASNRMAIYTLLKKKGFTDIILRTHCQHKDFIYNLKEIKQETDYWNLFDGMGFDVDGNLTFIQIKTNNFPPEKPINDFTLQHKVKAVAVNVTNKSGRWEVLIRNYPLQS